MGSTAVSTSVALVCLVAAGLMWTVGNKHGIRIIPILVLTGTAGIIQTPVGAKIGRAITWTLDLIGGTASGWFSTTAAVITALIAGALFYKLVMDLKKPSIDGRTLGCAVAVPFTASLIPGAIGAGIVTLLGGLAGLIASGIGSVTGWG